MRHTRLIIAALFVTAPFATNADVLTIGSTGGFDCTYTCTPTFQQLYRGSLFGTDTVTIESLANFANGGVYNGSWDIYLSTSQNSVGSISSTFADNRGGDEQLFGSISFSSSLLGLMDLVRIFGSFDYDPLAGDLLVEWVRTSAPSFSAGFQSSIGPDISRNYNFAANATSGFVNQNYGIATQFTFSSDTVAVPEPGTLALISVGLFGLGVARRRKQI